MQVDEAQRQEQRERRTCDKGGLFLRMWRIGCLVAHASRVVVLGGSLLRGLKTDLFRPRGIREYGTCGKCGLFLRMRRAGCLIAEASRVVVLGGSLLRGLEAYLFRPRGIREQHRVMAEQIDFSGYSIAMLKQSSQSARLKDLRGCATLSMQPALDVFEGLLGVEWVKYPPGRNPLIQLM